MKLQVYLFILVLFCAVVASENKLRSSSAQEDNGELSFQTEKISLIPIIDDYQIPTSGDLMRAYSDSDSDDDNDSDDDDSDSDDDDSDSDDDDDDSDSDSDDDDDSDDDNDDGDDGDDGDDDDDDDSGSERIAAGYIVILTCLFHLLF
jgi:hypothetical protein